MTGRSNAAEFTKWSTSFEVAKKSCGFANKSCICVLTAPPWLPKLRLAPRGERTSVWPSLGALIFWDLVAVPGLSRAAETPPHSQPGSHRNPTQHEEKPPGVVPRQR